MSWQKILAVQNMQSFIDEHIREKITLNQLADAAGYSPFHSAKIFKELTGKAPFDYIRALRLSQAAAEINLKKAKIIDVAFDFVFDSHEGFTRAFAREFGMSPKDFRNYGGQIKLFMPENVRNFYLNALKGVEKMTKTKNVIPVFVQVIERPQRKMVLKRGVKATHYFEYCQEVGCDIWEILSGIKNALNEPMGLWLPEKMIKPGTSMYCQGVEVPTDFNGDIPEGFEIIELPPCKIMVFQGPPYDDEKFEEAISELWEVIADYNPELYGFKWDDEAAPRFQLAPMGYRGYIEGKPVKENK